MSEAILLIVLMIVMFAIGYAMALATEMGPKKPKRRVLKRDARGRFIKG